MEMSLGSNVYLHRVMFRRSGREVVVYVSVRAIVSCVFVCTNEHNECQDKLELEVFSK